MAAMSIWKIAAIGRDEDPREIQFDFDTMRQPVLYKRLILIGKIFYQTIEGKGESYESGLVNKRS